MLNKEDITIEYVSPHIKIAGSVIRLDESENWYEIELVNNTVDRIWGITAQSRFYNKHGEFIGFEEDEHEPYLEPSRKVALAIFANPSAEYDQVKLTIDATVEEKEGEGIKDYLIVIGVLVLMVAGVAVYNLLN